MNKSADTYDVQPSESVQRVGIIFGQQDETLPATNVSQKSNCGTGMAGCGNTVPKVDLERCKP